MPGKRKKSGHGARSKARIGVKKKRRGEPRRKVTLVSVLLIIVSIATCIAIASCFDCLRNPTYFEELWWDVTYG